ncbi:MAG: Divergent AAA domain protein [Methanosaeta sp. PtaB.Bin039]|nr:MAG: Divergent AAA domain protein [Methanosaeta sp. PtaB.Bin039]
MFYMGCKRTKNVFRSLLSTDSSMNNMELTGPTIPKEHFAKFIENPTPENLREVLRTNTGEDNHLDFKEKMPDFPTLARHLLAMGNSRFGCIVIGVKELDNGTFDPIGIESIKDKLHIHDSIKRFIPREIWENILIFDFNFEETEYPKIKGKKFQVIIIDVDLDDLPLISTGASPGQIQENAIYVRRGTSSELVNYEELQRLINMRLSTGHSSQPEMDLASHLRELKMLLEENDNASKASLFPTGIFGTSYHSDHSAFLKELIENKKQLIRRIISNP